MRKLSCLVHLNFSSRTIYLAPVGRQTRNFPPTKNVTKKVTKFSSEKKTKYPKIWDAPTNYRIFYDIKFQIGGKKLPHILRPKICQNITTYFKA